jgi:hypothetical protein
MQTQRISKLIRKVQKLVAGDVFTIFIQQMRDQIFKIHTNNPDALGESYLGDSEIFKKNFNMDFIVSTPKDLIKNADIQIQSMSKQLESLNEIDLYLQQIEELKVE